MSSNQMAARLRLSAARAALFASILFLLALLWEFLDVALAHHRPLPWRISFALAAIFSGAAFIAVFVSTFLGRRTSDLGHETSVRPFRGAVLIRVFWACAAPAVLLFWGLGGFGDHRDPVLLLMLSLSLGLMVLLRWPRTITLDEVGITQRSWLGILRTIPYQDVVYISYAPGRGRTFVVGPAGMTITHTPSHSDRTLFQSLLEQRTRKEVRPTR